MSLSSAFSALPLRRFYKYIVKRLVGNYLKKDLDIEQFDVSVQLTKGVLQLRNLELDVNALNDDIPNSPFKFVDGVVGSFQMDIPWGNLLSGSCQVIVEDVHITVAGQQVVSVITSSVREPLPRRQFNLPTKREDYNVHTAEGIETLARLVKLILSKMEICVRNVKVSVLSEGTQPALLRILSSSINVFGGVTTGEVENRKCGIAGVSVYYVPLPVLEDRESSSPSFARQIPHENGSLLVCSQSDAMHAIHIAKRRLEDPECLLTPAELLYDIKVSIQSLKVTLGTSQISALIAFAEGLRVGVPDVKNLRQKKPVLKTHDFWYDLYVMFEKQPEYDATDEDEPLADISENPLPLATELPLATKHISLKINISKTSAFVVFSNTYQHRPWKYGVREASENPYPLIGDNVENHGQLCIGNTDVSVDVILPAVGASEAKFSVDVGCIDGYVHENAPSLRVADDIVPLEYDRDALEDEFFAALGDGFETASESESEGYKSDLQSLADLSCIDTLDSLFSSNWTNSEGAWRMKRVLSLCRPEGASYCASCEIKSGAITIISESIDIFLCRPSLTVISRLSLDPPNAVSETAGENAFKVDVTLSQIVVDLALGEPRGQMIRALGSVHGISLVRTRSTWEALMQNISLQLLGEEETTIMTGGAGSFRILDQAEEAETPCVKEDVAPPEEGDPDPIVGWTKISVPERSQQPRGKKILEQFRAKSSRLWPTRKGPRPPVSRIYKTPATSSLAEVPKCKTRCDVECALHVPQVSFRLTSASLLELEEGLTAFSLPYLPPETPSSPSKPPRVAFMLSVDSLWYHITEETDDPLAVHVSKLRMRYVGVSGKLGLLGKDVRLLRTKTLEEVIHPWYKALRSAAEPGNKDYPLRFPTNSIGEPAPFNLFDTIDDKTWVNEDCLMVRMDQKNRANAVHCHLDVEVNGLLWRASPDIFQIYSRLWAYLVPDVAPPPETAKTKARDRATFSVYHIGLKSCLFDIPATWFAEDENPDATRTKGIVHLDNCAFSMGSLYGQLTQGVKITMTTINGFIIDDVNHLPTATLQCSSLVPAPRFLSSLGYAHVCHIRQAKCVWKTQKTEHSAKIKNTITTNVEHASVHFCSDTIQCLMKLATALPHPKDAARLAHRPTDRSRRFNESELMEWDDLASETLPANPTLAESTAPVNSVLGGLLIEDYIRMQKNITPAVVVSANPEGEMDARQTRREEPRSSADMEEEALFDFEEDMPVGAQSTQPDKVEMCMLDLDQYPSEKIKELYEEESNARQEVQKMFPEPEHVGDIMHQSGTSATWFVEPRNMKIVHDHLVSIAGIESEANEATGSQKPTASYLWSVQLKVDDISMNMYAGTDFLIDSTARFQTLTSNDEDPLPNRFNRRQKNQALELKLESTLIKASGFPCENVPVEQLRRRFLLDVRDFVLYDNVHASVFQHVAAYLEDEDRPRSTSNSMLQVFVDELVSPILPTETMLTESAPEYVVDARILPLRFTVDQDTVEFCRTFLHLVSLPSYIEIEASESDGESPQERDSCPSTSEVHIELKELGVPKTSVPHIVFQHISISPLLLSIDYRAKRLDLNALRNGDMWQLCNLLPLLEGLEVCFRRISLRRIIGFDALSQALIHSWSLDIDRAQVLRTLMGITPIRSLANIGMSIGNLIRDPLRQYFQNPCHRGPHGVLRGLTSSLRNITVETISLTETLFVSAQNILEYAESRINPSCPVPRQRPVNVPTEDTITSDSWTALESGTQEFTMQPETAGEGMLYGFEYLQRSVQSASRAFDNPVVEMRRDQSMMSSYARGVPVMILRPAIGVSACAATTLRGFKNHVDGKRRKQALDKYKAPRVAASEKIEGSGSSKDQVTM